jgi:glucokinase
MISLVNDFSQIAAELKRVEAEKAEAIGCKPEQESAAELGVGSALYGVADLSDYFG